MIFYVLAGFASEASPLIMDVNCADGCSGNSGRQNDENNNATTMEGTNFMYMAVTNVTS